MYRRIIMCALVLTACGTTPNEQGPSEQLVTVGSQDGRTLVLPLTRDDYVTSALLAAPRETVWSLLPTVYEEVGLPAPAADPSTWTVAVQNHATMRRIGDERMSQLINCGMGVTGQIADTHSIRISVRTWLEGAGDSTEVRTRVEATASSVEGRAGSFACSSRGELEKIIATALHAAVVGGSQ